MTPLTSRLSLRRGALALALLAAAVARADDDPRLPRDTPAAYRQECAACHVAYPPGMLPAGSWHRLMSGLEQHFGTDASLDPDTVRRLSLWLQARAGTGPRLGSAPPEDRITRAAWFERKHREVDARVWKLDSVKSAANCLACHTGAERGDYDDDTLRIPAGVPQHLRRAWND